MEENEGKQENGMEEEAPAEVNWKNQVIALVTLLPVLGVLWLTIEYLPKFGDWMGGVADRVVGAESETALPDQEEKAEPKSAVERPESESEEPKSSRVASNVLPDFRAQITEQLGGADRVEVRHLAFSDDESRMVAALKLFEENGEGRLVEVFFERDEFGRFLSAEDSPLDRTLKLWRE